MHASVFHQEFCPIGVTNGPRLTREVSGKECSKFRRDCLSKPNMQGQKREGGFRGRGRWVKRYWKEKSHSRLRDLRIPWSRSRTLQSTFFPKALFRV